MSAVVRPTARAALAAAAVFVVTHAPPASAAPTAHADQVVSYNAGTDRFNFAAYTTPAVALGTPQTSTGPGFPVNPFNNPWSRNDVVSVGLGGQLTLRLARYAQPVAGAQEIGVFSFQQFLSNASGGTTAGPALFYPSVQARVDVSADGVNWVALNGGNILAFDVPAAAFRDAGATQPSDYGLPFTGGLDALKDKASLADTIAAYQGSAGGTWLDISNTGLPQVGFVRFSVPDTADFGFQLDGVSLNTAALGAAVPEPSLVGAAVIGLVVVGTQRRRR